MIPRKFYIALRLRRARNLIQQTDMAVIAVALACGSPSTFSHTHKQLFGLTPTQQRGIN